MSDKPVRYNNFIQLMKEHNEVLASLMPNNSCYLRKYLEENNIRYLTLESDNIPNRLKAILFYPNTILDIEELLIKKAIIHNVTGSRFNVSCEELYGNFISDNYYRNYDAALKISKALNIDCSTKAINHFMSNYKENFNYIIIKERYFFRKEQIDKCVDFLESTITVVDAFKIIKEKLKERKSDINILYRTFSAQMKKNGYVLDNPTPFKNTHFRISKCIIDDLVNNYKIENEFNKSETIYGKLQIYISNNESKNGNIHDTLELFNKYALDKSNKYRGRTPISVFTRLKHVYDAMTSFLKKEIYLLDTNELENMARYVEQYSVGTVDIFRQFYNYTLSKRKTDAKPLPIAKKKSKSKIYPYELDKYISILFIIMSKLCDRDFINILLENRGLSSLVLYIYTHFTAVWRRADIVEGIPLPNLNLIGFNDAEQFIEWIRNGNIFTENMGRKICKDIEVKIYARREAANKNNSELLLYISEYMYSTYGLILAICEANRILVEKKGDRVRKTTTLIAVGASSKELQERLLPSIFEDVNSLFVEGTFSNRRANKSFETYVAKKSEEWNIGIGYILASILRGHRLNDKLISEITQIYINKDINDASLLSFMMGTMSGIKYRLLQASGFEISNKKKSEIDSKALDIKISPYQIEVIYKNLSERVSIINKFFDEVLSGNVEVARATLKEVLYGKMSYGKQCNTKCLYRAYMNIQRKDVLFIAKYNNPCINANTEGCIGCPFLIASKYFLYELEEKLSQAIYMLNNSHSVLDIRMHLERIVTLYMPLIKEAYNELGNDYVDEIIDINSMMIAINKYKYLLE